MRIALDDVTLEVEDTGDGSPVLLLHGWPDAANVWRHQVPALAAHHYRVLAPDLRGFGGSSSPPRSRPMWRRGWSATSSACSTRRTP